MITTKLTAEQLQVARSFQAIRNKARYGHRNWLFWGDGKAMTATAKNVRLAMLESGTRRPIYLIHSDGSSSKLNWRGAVTLWRSLQCNYSP